MKRKVKKFDQVQDEVVKQKDLGHTGSGYKGKGSVNSDKATFNKKRR